MDEAGNIIISHQTSAMYWRHVGSSRVASMRPSDADPLADCVAPSMSLDLFNADFPSLSKPPIHLLIPDKCQTRSCSKLRTHLAPARLPEGSFYQIGRRLFVCSPELTLMQLARFMSPVQLIEATSEMLSDYYFNPQTGGLEKRRCRITSAKQIKEYARHSACGGWLKTDNAVDLAFPSARSPMEIKAAMAMALKRPLGAYAFPPLVLNYPIPLDGRRNLVEQDDFYVDIAFPDYVVGVEYFGIDYHADSARDRRRINGLRALGWEILTLEKSQLYNRIAFHTFMRQLAEVLNQARMQMPGARNPSTSGEGLPVRKVVMPPDSIVNDPRYLRLRADLGLL